MKKREPSVMDGRQEAGAALPADAGPFLRKASEIRSQDFEACHGGAGAVKGRHVLEHRDGLSIPFMHDDVLPPGVTIGEHVHTGDEEIYYVLEGRGTMILNGVRHAIDAGDVSVVRRGHSHGLINDGGAPLRIIVVASRV